MPASTPLAVVSVGRGLELAEREVQIGDELRRDLVLAPVGVDRVAAADRG